MESKLQFASFGNKSTDKQRELELKEAEDAKVAAFSQQKKEDERPVDLSEEETKARKNEQESSNDSPKQCEDGWSDRVNSQTKTLKERLEVLNALNSQVQQDKQSQENMAPDF